jgi:hypothetical protein
MADSKPAGGLPTDLVCPWCSAALKPGATDCPSCGAQLKTENESDLPGLTSIDPRAKPLDIKPKSKNRILSWISGDYTDDALTKTDARAVAPPDLAVQEEILRLQIAADLADLQAEVASLQADDLVETGVSEPSEADDREVEVEAEAEAAIATATVSEEPSDPDAESAEDPAAS